MGTLTIFANIILSVGSDEPIFATCCLQVTIMHAVLIQDCIEDGRGFEGVQEVRVNPIIKLTAVQHVATSQGRD